MRYEYAVLGAGALGLTTALRLLQQGNRVTVFEREARPGGLAAGFPLEWCNREVQTASTAAEDIWLEKYYHHLFRSDRAMISLISELGLGDQLLWRRPTTVTLRGGQAYQLDSPLSLLRFSPIPLIDRLRMGMMLAYLRFLSSSRGLEGKRAASWIQHAMGYAAYETVWGPLLQGKFGPIADEIALPWFWARVHDRSAELGYIRGGFQHFYNHLAQRIDSLEGTIHLETEVQRIEVNGQDISISMSPTGILGKEETQHFDRVISTLPTRLTCRLAPQLPERYRSQYDWGCAYGAHCLILALNRPLTQSYWMNINDPGYPFMVLVEHTNYMSPSDYSGRHLVYLGNYRPMGDPLLCASKDEVLREFLPHLTRINPAFDRSWLEESWMFAASFAQPIVSTDYKDHIPPFDTPMRGLFVANMFQVYPHDRGQNYSVELAERLVRHLERSP